MAIPTIIRDDETEVSLPWRWEICPCCEGHGTDRGASVECDGGGFTASEWAEQDEEFRDDYLAGRYDRPCGECRGKGRVEVVDEDRCSPEQLTAWEEHCAEEAEYRAMVRAERRMGC